MAIKVVKGKYNTKVVRISLVIGSTIRLKTTASWLMLMEMFMRACLLVVRKMDKEFIAFLIVESMRGICMMMSCLERGKWVTPMGINIKANSKMAKKMERGLISTPMETLIPESGWMTKNKAKVNTTTKQITVLIRDLGQITKNTVLVFSSILMGTNMKVNFRMVWEMDEESSFGKLDKFSTVFGAMTRCLEKERFWILMEIWSKRSI